MKEQPGEAGEEQSQLYLLRVWTVARPGDEVAYRGKLQPVLSDGSYYFASAAELLGLLASLFSGTAGSSPGDAIPYGQETEEG